MSYEPMRWYELALWRGMRRLRKRARDKAPPVSFEGIDRGVSTETLAGKPVGQITPDELLEALQRMYVGPEYVTELELHNPECPKWLWRGARACRCGVAPLEEIFEDELMVEFGR